MNKLIGGDDCVDKIEVVSIVESAVDWKGKFDELWTENKNIFLIKNK